MTDEHAAIARTFEPPDLEPLLAECGVDATVLVQSAASDEDTDYMFEVAGAVEWVGGDRRPGAGSTTSAVARRRLDELQASPKLRGIRHLIHQEPDPHWILDRRSQPASRCSRTRGSCSSCPPCSQTISTTSRARRTPPRLDDRDRPPGEAPAWNRRDGAVGRAAARRGGAAERAREGLRAEHGDARPATGRRPTSSPRSSVALDAFGPERLVLGSDWPVALLNGDYERVQRETTARRRARRGRAAARS